MSRPVIYVLVVILCAQTSSCAALYKREYALILNMSDSANERLALRTTQTSRTESHGELLSRLGTVTGDKPMRILVAAKDQIDITCQRGLKAETYGGIVERLTKQREQQLGPVSQGPQVTDKNSVDSAVTPEPFWGWGTDHASPIRWLAQHRGHKTKLVLFIVSDGFNEVKGPQDPFQDVQAALKELYKSGPTQVFLLGVSSQAVDADSRVRVKDKWEQMFKDAGAKPIASKGDFPGYYLDSELTVPDVLAPMRQ